MKTLETFPNVQVKVRKKNGSRLAAGADILEDLFALLIDEAIYNDLENNPTVMKRLRRKDVSKKAGKCSFCPPHREENRRKKSKPDKYKSRRSR